MTRFSFRRLLARSAIPHWIGLLGIFLLGSAQPVHAAPPANDSISAALVVPSALPAEVAGSNAEATEEVGEPLPLNARRSVWWKWTATTSGWVRIFTTTATDTVLAAYVGDTLTTLERLVFNDDFDEYAPGPSAARVLVTAGVNYKMQVCGYLGETGPITLRIEFLTAPPTVIGLAFTPAAANVSTSEAVVTADFSSTSTLAVTGGDISIFRPGDLTQPVAISTLTRVTGTATAGTYRAALTLPRYLAAGPYTALISLLATGRETFSYGKNTSLPADLVTTLQIINTGIADSTPPTLASLVLSPGATVDVTSAGQTVVITPRFVDQPAGMTDFASWFFLRSPGDVVDIGDIFFSRRTRQSGDNFDGTYRFSVTIPAGAPPGTYPLLFSLTDSISNSVVHGPLTGQGETPLPVGLPTAITVVNTGSVDTAPPVLTNATTTPGTVNVAAFESCQLTLDVTDNRSGVAIVDFADVVAGLRPVGGGAIIPISASFKRITGTATAGSYRATLYPPATTAPGTYQWVGLLLKDALGNTRTYGPAGLGLTSFPAGVSPQVIITSQTPTTPYALWLANFPSLTGPAAARTADPDGDGYSNLVELALGLDPTKSSTPRGNDPNRVLAPRVTITPTRLSLTYTTAGANLGSGPFQISISASESTDLLNWSGAVILIGEETVAFTNIEKGERKYLRIEVFDPSAP